VCEVSSLKHGTKVSKRIRLLLLVFTVFLQIRGFCASRYSYWGHEAAQLVEALRYKSEVMVSIPDGVIEIFH